MMRRVVVKITAEELQRSHDEGIPVFDYEEIQFFERHAPYYARGLAYSTPPADEMMLLESAVNIFNIVVRLDSTVFHGNQLEKTAMNKAALMNKHLRAWELESITTDGHHLNILYDTKMRGIEILERAAEAFPFPTMRRNADTRWRDAVADPTGIERGLNGANAFFDSASVLLYGSAMKKKEYTDIDLKIRTMNFTKTTYHAIEGAFNAMNPFDIVIIPEGTRGFEVFDPYNATSEKRSILLQGEYTAPVVPDEFLKKLICADVAENITRLREAICDRRLTETVVKRVNSLLKRPKFLVYRYNEHMCTEITPPQVQQVECMPDPETLCDLLIDANMTAYRFMKENPL